MTNYFFLILGMGFVTYLPRLIPFIALNDSKINKNVKEFLSYIPYTSLSVLIIRGIMTAGSGMKIATIASIGIAGVLSYIKGNLVLSVLVGILLSFVIINTSIII